MPKIAAFPKAFIDELCVTGSMTLRRWIELAASLDIDGLEFYHGFPGLEKSSVAAEARRIAADHLHADLGVGAAGGEEQQGEREGHRPVLRVECHVGLLFRGRGRKPRTGEVFREVPKNLTCPRFPTTLTRHPPALPASA